MNICESPTPIVATPSSAISTQQAGFENNLLERYALIGRLVDGANIIYTATVGYWPYGKS